MTTPEEKLLRVFIKNTLENRNYPIRQEIPTCPRCYIPIDLMDFSIKVDFNEVVVGGKTFIFAEPYCPKCSIKIKAAIYINN